MYTNAVKVIKRYVDSKLYFRCIEMIETEFVPEHQAPHVIVGKCDSGPLSFTFQNNTTPSIWTDYSQMVNISRLRWNFIC